MNLKISLKELNVPAVQAVRGYQCIWSGLDYRGVKVLAEIRPIAGTPWFMVAKIDRSELFAELRSKAFYTVLFVFVLVMLIAAGLDFLYYLKQRDVYRQLYRSRQEFRTTLYSIGDAVITTDIRGKIKYLNPVAAELTGWRERQVVGKPLRRVFKIINEDTRRSVENPVERVLREGLVVGLANHTLLITKDGREVPIADSGAPIRDEDGNIIGVVLVFRDQTAERAAQKALEESEEKYRLIVENSHDGIEISQDDRIIFCNARFAEMLGYTAAEIKNIPFSRIFTEEATRELYGRQALHRAGEVLPHFYETTFYRKDHSVIDVQVSYEIIDYKGKPATFATIRDITAQKKAQKEYQQLINGMNDTAFVISFQGIFIEVNEAAVRTLGYSREELLNMGPTDIDPHMSAADIGKLIEGMQTDRRQVFETQHRAKDGRIIPVEIHSSQVMYKGERAILSICRDITERKEAQKALEESERKLKTLMDNLQGMVYSCLNDKDWTVKFVSEGALPLTGYSPGELIDNRVLAYNDIIHPDDRELVWSSIQEALAEREPYMLEYRIITKDGAQKWIWERGRGVFSAEGELLALEGIISDISDFKEAQDKISQLKDNLETEVAEKTRELQQRVAELERFHDATIERELRMKELRDEIERLKAERE
ncbi:MAG: PAS domain S-box protein [Fidelibacterota bacterium]